jgi:hypothetical protein
MGTIDFHFNKEIKKGTDLNDPGNPHLLKFEKSIPHVGEFQSMEVQIHRDGKLKHSIGLRSFHMMPKGGGTWVTFQVIDMRRKVIKHDYVLDADLHFKS